MIFPWQTSHWQQLLNAKRENRLPHALLLTGSADIGKKHFAAMFANTLLCHKTDDNGDPCQICHACHLIRAESHPDLLFVSPEQSGQMIKIDQIRDVIHFGSETSLQSRYKVIIIHSAHSMNIYAANALLKTLEEPAKQTLFLLCSDQAGSLPATIISRCQKISFVKPQKETALNWLAPFFPEEKNLELLLDLAEGAPLKVKEFLENGIMEHRKNLYNGLYALAKKSSSIDPLQLAIQNQEIDNVVFFNLLFNWLRDLLRFKLTNGSAALMNVDFQHAFNDISQKISRENIVCYMDTVQKAYKNVINMINLNRQLLLEDLFIHWTRYVSC